MIDVVFRDWHTVIVTQREPGRYHEWEFCEKAWYLEGRQGLTGVCRSLLWPTASGVGSGVATQPTWKRFQKGDVRRWTFVLSEPGLRAMEGYLETEKGPGLVEFPGWFEGQRSYYLFYNCHHFTASALRAAGLPIRPWWAFCGWMVAMQLDRVRWWHEKEMKA